MLEESTPDSILILTKCYNKIYLIVICNLDFETKVILYKISIFFILQ